MPAPFRIGLAGAGRMGGNHLRALAGSDRVAITAIAEPAAQTRSRLAGSGMAASGMAGAGMAGSGMAGSGAVVYASLGEMLDRAVLDAVLIAAPSDQHLQIVSETAARGLPILCEKPCGTSSGQARAAAEIAAAAGVPLQVAYWRRFFPALRQVRDQMAGGELGTTTW